MVPSDKERFVGTRPLTPRRKLWPNPTFTTERRGVRQLFIRYKRRVAGGVRDRCGTAAGWPPKACAWPSWPRGQVSRLVGAPPIKYRASLAYYYTPGTTARLSLEVLKGTRGGGVRRSGSVLLSIIATWPHWPRPSLTRARRRHRRRR